MTIKIQDEAGNPLKPRVRTSPQRPTTPVLEHLYMDLALKLSKREAALIMCALGRVTVEECKAEFSGE
jgi:hypothetical protein